MDTEIFNPAEFAYSWQMPIDGTFWVELDGNEGVPTTSDKKFYTPGKKARKGWAERLEASGVEPSFVFDPAVGSLPLNLSPETIENVRLGMNKCVIKSLEDPTPVPPPEKLDPERCLKVLQMRVIAGLSFGSVGEQDLTPFERNLLKWNKGYGFLWDHRQNVGVLFPEPGEQTRLKHEIDREYLFQIPNFHYVAISLSRTPNYEHAVWGLRRSAEVDWPFDKMYGRKWFDTDKVVDKMNVLLGRLETFINSS